MQTMPDDLPPRADMIAKTRGAQTREAALEHVKNRRASYVPQAPQQRTVKDEDLTRSEPAPTFDFPDPPPPPKPRAPMGKKRQPSERPPRPHPPHKTKKDVPFRVIDGGKKDPERR